MMIEFNSNCDDLMLRLIHLHGGLKPILHDLKRPMVGNRSLPMAE
jgi:hypothetical protein